MKRFILIGGLIWAIIIGLAATQTASVQRATMPLLQLSEYGLFVGDLADQQPAADVLPYTLNSPLFSDYAFKKRFIRLPEGTAATYNDTEVFDFPVGTVIAKTFYYPADFRKPDGNHQLIETRILIHEAAGWKALPYVWNAEQTDAMLDVAGARREVSWRDERGKKQKLSYSVPNLNQCKGCHYRDGQEIVPIGPSARQLNGDLTYADETFHQLTRWRERGWLRGITNQTVVPTVVDYTDATQPLEARARAYLDVNCGHCHNPKGPANTSGLFLHIHETDPQRLGVNKAPIAAGRGSGNLPYSIVPGAPDRSIMVYRMASEDPGVMMPEVSRKLVHQEGVELIREWIAAME